MKKPRARSGNVTWNRGGKPLREKNTILSSEMYTKLARIKNIKNLSIGTDRPMQTVQTQIRRRREQGNETNFGEQESWQFGKHF